MGKIKYVYVGMDPETPIILSNDKDFELAGVALIDTFFTQTLNPINFIFKSVFFLRKEEKLRWLEKLLIIKWKFLNPFSSSIFFKFKDYLTFISENNAKILDFEDIEKTEKYIQENKIDLIVVNAWDLLPENIIKAPKYGTINIHPSKLPKYKGALPTLWALKNGDKETAVTYLLVDKSVDGGKILAQHEISIGENDNAIDLEYKIADVLKETLADDIKRYIKGESIPYFQNENGTSKTGKYYEYLKIDLKNEKARDIYNKIKLYPFLEPGLHCFVELNNRKIEIKNANFSLGKISEYSIARDVSLKFPYLLFQAKDGIIKSRIFMDLSFLDSIFVLMNLN